jgi:hypothetical protein
LVIADVIHPDVFALVADQINVIGLVIGAAPLVRFGGWGFVG